MLPLFAGPLFVIVAGMVHDKLSEGRIHRAWIVGGAIVMIVHAGRIAVMFVPAWLDFADWVMRLS